MKVRIKFTKIGAMKFIGHLDIMRYFQKAFKRAGYDVEYSKGFNPHQILSFAAPLGVGVTSESEYLDVQLNTCLSEEEMIKNINNVMAEGISVVEFRILPDNSKNSMSIVACADYIVNIKDDSLSHNLKNKFIEFTSLNEIMVLKKTKKSEKEIDIKPMIYDIKFINENEVFMKLATGSENNIKPQSVVEAMCNFANIEYNLFTYQVHRTEVYANDGTSSKPEFISLNEI